MEYSTDFDYEHGKSDYPFKPDDHVYCECRFTQTGKRSVVNAWGYNPQSTNMVSAMCAEDQRFGPPQGYPGQTFYDLQDEKYIAGTKHNDGYPWDGSLQDPTSGDNYSMYRYNCGISEVVIVPKCALTGTSTGLFSGSGTTAKISWNITFYALDHISDAEETVISKLTFPASKEISSQGWTGGFDPWISHGIQDTMSIEQDPESGQYYFTGVYNNFTGGEATDKNQVARYNGFLNWTEMAFKITDVNFLRWADKALRGRLDASQRNRYRIGYSITFFQVFNNNSPTNVAAQTRLINNARVQIISWKPYISSVLSDIVYPPQKTNVSIYNTNPYVKIDNPDPNGKYYYQCLRNFKTPLGGKALTWDMLEQLSSDNWNRITEPGKPFQIEKYVSLPGYYNSVVNNYRLVIKQQNFWENRYHSRSFQREIDPIYDLTNEELISLNLKRLLFPLQNYYSNLGITTKEDQEKIPYLLNKIIKKNDLQKFIEELQQIYNEVNGDSQNFSLLNNTGLITKENKMEIINMLKSL